MINKMSGIDADTLTKMVLNVVETLNKDSKPAASSDCGCGVFQTMDDAIEAAKLAQKQYIGHSMADRARYIQVIRDLVLDRENLEWMSRAAAEETGIGALEYKLIKNELVARKTPGIEDLTTDAYSGDDGLTLEEYSPYGVIGAITPTTNPTETIVCNSIGMLAAGNSVVFSPHPRAKEVSKELIRMLNRALVEVGAPMNLITTVQEPSLDNTNAMMEHKDISMLVATGGPGIVKKVMQSGKKAIGAGAGNPPVVVDETADIEKAAKDIIAGASFDNNVPCVAEKEILVCENVADYLIFNMKNNGAYLLDNPDELKMLEALVLSEKGGPRTEWVGKSAQCILAHIGVDVGDDIKIVLIETDKDHPFVQHEMMMPVLPLVRVSDVDTAIDLAIELEHGNRHTAIMHSKNVDKLTRMGKLIQTTVFVKNGPSYAGLGGNGEGYCSFTIAGPTGEGLTSAKNFCRKRRCILVGGFDIR